MAHFSQNFELCMKNTPNHTQHVQNTRKNAHKKWRAARATQHTTHTSSQIPLPESSTPTQWANFWIPTLHPQIRSSAAADLTQTLHTSSLASPQATFKIWTKSASISKSYDQNNFASFYSLKMHQKNQRMFELFLYFSRSPGSPVCKPFHAKNG